MSKVINAQLLHFCNNCITTICDWLIVYRATFFTSACYRLLCVLIGPLVYWFLHLFYSTVITSRHFSFGFTPLTLQWKSRLTAKPFKLGPPNLATFPSNYLGTFWSHRDVNVNIDVTTATKFWPPCFSKFAFFFSHKKVLILISPMVSLYYT